MDVRARKAEPEVGGRVLGSQRLIVLRIVKDFETLQGRYTLSGRDSA